MLAPWKESYNQPKQHIRKQKYYFANKGLYNQSYGFSSSHVWMWELDHKEIWASKNWYFWIAVLEKTLEGPLECKEIQLVNPKGNQSWVFTERTDVLKLKLQYFGHLMRRTDSLEKTLMLGRLKAGEEGDDWGWNGWLAPLTQWTWVCTGSRRWWWTGKCAAVHGVTKSWTRLCNWAELNWINTQCWSYTAAYFQISQHQTSSID